MAHTVYKNNDGKKIPSVTTIISKTLAYNKDALLAWTRKLALQGIDPKKVSKDAADTGTLIHKCIECYVKNDLENEKFTSLKSKATFDQVIISERGLAEYKVYETDNELRMLESEYQFVDDEYEYAGTIDAISNSKRNIGLLDFKSSKSIYADHIIQAAAYYYHASKKFDIKYVDLLHIRKDFDNYNEGTNIITPINIPNDLLVEGWEVFKRLRYIYEKESVFNSFTEQFKEKK